MEMMLDLAIGVMDMEDDKVADMVLKFPYEIVFTYLFMKNTK